MKNADSLAVPVFRRIFSCGRPVSSARLEVTCDGVYEAVLNGQRVGQFILAPGWTEYSKRLQVQSYDVTQLLAGGDTLYGTDTSAAGLSGRQKASGSWISVRT